MKDPRTWTMGLGWTMEMGGGLGGRGPKGEMIGTTIKHKNKKIIYKPINIIIFINRIKEKNHLDRCRKKHDKIQWSCMIKNAQQTVVIEGTVPTK